MDAEVVNWITFADFETPSLFEASLPDILYRLIQAEQYIRNGIEFGSIRPATDPLDRATGFPAELHNFVERIRDVVRPKLEDLDKPYPPHWSDPR